MKKFLFLGAMLTLLASGSAYAISADQCLDDGYCTTTVTVDSGNTGKKCAGSPSLCSCQGYFCPWYVTSGSCAGNYQFAGNTVTGKKCCINNSQCLRAEDGVVFEQTPEESVISLNNEELQGVFLEEMTAESFSTAHFGVVNNTNRSPNTGRTTSVSARLDACLGHGTADTATSLLSCYSKCDNTSNGSDANHCNSNNSAVCDDRCECKFGSASCNNL